MNQTKESKVNKQLRQLTLNIYFYWRTVNIENFSVRELTTAGGLTPEKLLEILGTSAETLFRILPGTQNNRVRELRKVLVRLLAHVRSGHHHDEPEEVFHARCAQKALKRFVATGELRDAWSVTGYAHIPATHMSPDSHHVREVRRQAITLVWKKYTWEGEQWRRWLFLKEWLENTGLAPADVDVSPHVFRAEYRRVIVNHFAPALYRDIQRGISVRDEGVGTWQLLAVRAIDRLLLLIHREQVLSWEEAPCTRRELIEATMALDEFPCDQERLLRIL